jgi:replicative DNA helicase
MSQAARVIEARRRLADLPLTIETQGGLSMSQIATRARKLNDRLDKKGQRLGLLIVDHMHIVAASSRYAGHKVHEVTEISAGLKALAKELEVPVLALAQLSRQVEARDNKRPGLSDLRESGAIEQDADLIIFLYREAYYLKDRIDDDAKEPRVSTGWRKSSTSWKPPSRRTATVQPPRWNCSSTPAAIASITIRGGHEQERRRCHQPKIIRPGRPVLRRRTLHAPRSVAVVDRGSGL